MSRVRQFQSNFTMGEMDPLLRGRVDIEQYYSAVSKAQNVLFEPQGGFSRRPGLKFIADYTSSVSVTDAIRLIPFIYSTGQTYLIVVTMTSSSNLRFYFYKDQVLQTNINSSGNNYVDYSYVNKSQLTTLRELNYTQSADTLIVTNRDIAPFSVVRGANDTTWTVAQLTLTQPYIRGTLLGASESLSLPASTLTPSATSGAIKLTASASVFSSGNVHQYVYLNTATSGSVWNGFGKAQITKYISGTVVEAVVEVPFANTDAVAQNLWTLDASYIEPWSNTYGYPHTCTFHEARLYFGGSWQLPMTLFGSKVGDFYNFRPSEGLSDDAFRVTLTTDTVNSINGLRSGRDLQIFTTGGEFFIPQADLEPITPTNVSVKSTTKRGSKDGIKPVATEGGTFFIQQQGKAIREMAFSDVELSYVAQNISLLASHLIVDPLAMAIRPASDTTEGDLLMVVNGTSTTGYRSASSGLAGTLACYMLNKQQNIVAPSFFVTDGQFRDIAVLNDETYVIVKRTVNSATKYYLEVFDDDFTTDSSVQKTSSFSGTSYNLVSHLQAKTVKVVRDDIVESDVSNVSASGTITTSSQPTTYIETGLDFTIEVITNPAEPRLPSGTVVTQKKRILEISPIMYRTQNLTLNGYEVPLQTLPYSGGGTVPTITGIKKVQGLVGYDNDAQITISQSKPVFFTVLSMDFKLAVGG